MDHNTDTEWTELVHQVEEWTKSWKPGTSGHKTGLDALRWYVAFHEAEDMRDSYGAKDWAEVVLEGLQPVPRTVPEIVESWWGPQWEEWEDGLSGDGDGDEKAEKPDPVGDLDKWYAEG